MTEPPLDSCHSRQSGERGTETSVGRSSDAPEWDRAATQVHGIAIPAGTRAIAPFSTTTDALQEATEATTNADNEAAPEISLPQAGSGLWNGRLRAPGWMVLMAARSLAVLIVVALFVLTFIVQPFSIPSESMEPTLLIGDFMLVNQAVFAPPGRFGWLLPHQPVRSGDIIVFHFPFGPYEYVVKRVVGVPGDRIHLENGVVYRNGRALREPYAVYLPSPPDRFRDDFPSGPYTDPNINPRWWAQLHSYESGDNLVVPPGEYFVMGDNRNRSLDSRYWGFVPRADIEGQPLVIYFSRRRISSANLPAVTRNDKLSRKGVFGPITGFARWNRTLRIVR